MPDLILGLYGGRRPDEPLPVDQCGSCGKDLFPGELAAYDPVANRHYCPDACGYLGAEIVTLHDPEPDPDDDRD